MPAPSTPDRATAVREFCLALPGAWEDFPWEDHPVIKVGKKVFAFLPHAPYFRLVIKLPLSRDEALSYPQASLSGYGLGRFNWCEIPLGDPQADPADPQATLAPDGGPELDLLCDWVLESYRAVAPKRLAAQLEQ